MTVDRVGVHATHCCTDHGCKYNYLGEDCPVTTGEVEQEYPCEYCDDEFLARKALLAKLDAHSKKPFWRSRRKQKALLDEVTEYFEKYRDQ
jgi:hypothetical protein